MSFLFGGNEAPAPQPIVQAPAIPDPPVMPVPNDKEVAAAKKKQLAVQAASGATRQRSVLNQQGSLSDTDTLA